MAISIKDPVTDAKARELARLTGESLTDAVRHAIEQRLARESFRARAGIADQLLMLSSRLARKPRLFAGSVADALGYDEHGLPR